MRRTGLRFLTAKRNPECRPRTRTDPRIRAFDASHCGAPSCEAWRQGCSKPESIEGQQSFHAPIQLFAERSAPSGDPSDSVARRRRADASSEYSRGRAVIGLRDFHPEPATGVTPPLLGNEPELSVEGCARWIRSISGSEPTAAARHKRVAQARHQLLDRHCPLLAGLVSDRSWRFSVLLFWREQCQRDGNGNNFLSLRISPMSTVCDSRERGEAALTNRTPPVKTDLKSPPAVKDACQSAAQARTQECSKRIFKNRAAGSRLRRALAAP